MRFEPLDTGLIVTHLRQSLPQLHAVGGAADYAAVKELAAFRTPSAFVVFAEEANSGKFPPTPGVCFQSSIARFAVVLALRHYREQLGSQMQQEARALVGAVRCALIGHKLPVKGAQTLAWDSGRVLDYDAGVLLFADLYHLHYTLHKED